MKWFEMIFRSSRPEVFYEKGLLKMCSKFTGEFPCWSAISIKLLCNFIEITLQHECSPVNLLYIFRKPFPRNTSGWLLKLLLFEIYVFKTWNLETSEDIKLVSNLKTLQLLLYDFIEYSAFLWQLKHKNSETCTLFKSSQFKTYIFFKTMPVNLKCNIYRQICRKAYTI